MNEHVPFGWCVQRKPDWLNKSVGRASERTMEKFTEDFQFQVLNEKPTIQLKNI